MKKILFIFGIFLMFTALFAQENGGEYQIFYYPNGQKSSEGWLVDGKPDGWWKSYNQDGILVSEGNRKNFLLDSVWIFYNNLGEKTLEIHYKEGKKEGTRVQYFEHEYMIETWHQDTLIGDVTTYHSSGWVKKTVPHVSGKPHGIAKEFTENGTVTAVLQYYRGVLTHREYINKTDKFGQKQGKWKTFWKNGNLQSEGSYLNDKKHGFFKDYDTLGNFVAVYKFANDVLVEDAKETKILEKKTAYHANGKPSITATYYKNKPDGIRREFDTNGVLIKGYLFDNGVLRNEGITNLDGLREGEWKEFYDSGALRSQGKYKKSKPVGKWTFFFEDKTIEIEGNYNKKGEKDGEWLWYYPNGNLLMRENYVDGNLEGDFVEYDEEERVITKGQYVDNQEDGDWFYQRGDHSEKGHFFEGNRVGVWKTWHENGTLASEMHYEQDLLDGKCTIYWENGAVKLTGKYISGERTGLWYKYTEEGALILTTTYKNGYEIKWDNYKIYEDDEEKSL